MPRTKGNSVNPIFHSKKRVVSGSEITKIEPTCIVEDRNCTDRNTESSGACNKKPPPATNLTRMVKRSSYHNKVYRDIDL